jgi:formate hydrogenlyase subunit 6/NADH:ubiquinone oxidoreductase subunit I
MPMDVLDRILRPLRNRRATGGYPDALPDLPSAARGLPELAASLCDGNGACVEACPTGAIRLAPATWSLDAGLCIFCGACARACAPGAIRIGSRIELASDRRDGLVVVTARERPA